MLDKRYIRAEYDEERGSFVSVDAEWRNGTATLEYRFTFLEDEDDTSGGEGGLEKRWIDDENSQDSEIFIFANYASRSEFEADVQEILQEAKERRADENIDEFLAVIDIVKERAIEAGYEEMTFDDLEGLFEDGPEDAYSLRNWDDSPRLHDHVERADECWYLHVGQVVDTDQQPLGWGIFAVHIPELGANATSTEIQNADHARVLLIDHHKSQQDAKLAESSFLHFMETERMDDPEYAYTDDTEILENMVVESEWDEAANIVNWREFHGQGLRDFLSGKIPFSYPREKWKPLEPSLVDRFFKEQNYPVWLEDQLRAALEEQTGIEPEDSEDSPWDIPDLD